MSSRPDTGHGSARIVLVRPTRPDAGAGASPSAVSQQRRPEPRSRPQRTARKSAWTTQRLMAGAIIGGIATVAGGMLFAHNFTLLGGSRGPILAVTFGLFVIGVLVFAGCLAVLLGRVINAFADRQGWIVTMLALFAPVGLLAGLWQIGAVNRMFPALFTMLVIFGLISALQRYR